MSLYVKLICGSVNVLGFREAVLLSERENEQCYLR
jgi:hypothetical protein